MVESFPFFLLQKEKSIQSGKFGVPDSKYIFFASLLWKIFSPSFIPGILELHLSQPQPQTPLLLLSASHTT